ncbi:hypothetical protein Nepgr_031305 [Nepenthes gracilis]|uniref:Uncharacterized protein n=1 Tax=Nepenthes gracilis TaxID=150966 RepID=A0AAD3TIK5_NEPGR|nr:hypothetical protein Nepgr_031305 [Nepenthes gracilis]
MMMRQLVNLAEVWDIRYVVDVPFDGARRNARVWFGHGSLPCVSALDSCLCDVLASRGHSLGRVRAPLCCLCEEWPIPFIEWFERDCLSESIFSFGARDGHVALMLQQRAFDVASWPAVAIFGLDKSAP